MVNDFINVTYLWFLILVIGLVCLPTTFKIFTRFSDLGYIFAKVLGLAIISYLIWLLGSLHLLPFSTFSSWVIFLLLGLINLFLATKSHKDILQKLKEKWKIIVFEEIIFSFAFLFWAYIRAHEPSIHGLEKFMDFGFINSILRTDFFPPKDLWLTPATINYYYFGHLVTAVLTKLSGIAPEISFNLMMATIFGLTFTGAFSIGLNLAWWTTRGGKSESAGSRPIFERFPCKRQGVWAKLSALSRENRKPKKSLTVTSARYALLGPIATGLLSAFLVTLAGNLHTIYAFTRGFDKYWYPDATRFIPYTIHEFPSYSWVVSDLHGHVLDIPFVLLTIALLLSLIFNFQFSIFNEFKNFKIKNLFKISNLKFKILLISFLLALMYMTNAWDGIIYLGLAILVLFFLNLQIVYSNPFPQIQNSKFKMQNYKLKVKIFICEFQFCLLPFAFCLLLLLLGFFLLTLPFTLHFKPFASGVHLVSDHSPLYMLATLWGFFYFFAASFLIFLYAKIKFAIRSASWRTQFAISPIDVFILLLILLSTLLLLFPEIAYIKDIYPLHYRANTMFKLGYQAFIMLSISSAYIFIRIITSGKNIFVLLFFCFSSLLFIPVAIYPYFGVKSYYNGLKVYQGLNGMNWLKNQYPADYEAIMWLRSNVKNQPVILEAVGESYTDYARVSSFTGLPTILGWPVHEWLWRGTYDEAGRRDAEVRQAYETPILTQTKEFLAKYKVEYVFVGTLERQKYPKADFTKWEKLGEKIYQSNQTLIYQVSP